MSIWMMSGLTPVRPSMIARQRGASQFSNATPRESPSRQISRHLGILRKLSKDNSKFGGRTGKSSERMPAPTLVISVTQHDRTPFCPPKNSKPPLSILVLAIDLRSFIAIMRALDDAPTITSAVSAVDDDRWFRIPRG